MKEEQRMECALVTVSEGRKVQRRDRGAGGCMVRGGKGWRKDTVKGVLLREKGSRKGSCRVGRRGD